MGGALEPAGACGNALTVPDEGAVGHAVQGRRGQLMEAAGDLERRAHTCAFVPVVLVHGHAHIPLRQVG